MQLNNLWLVTRKSEDWNAVVPALRASADALAATATMFRMDAAAFPPAAQAGLAALPQYYEQRLSVIETLKQLAQGQPPTTQEDLASWKELIEIYDKLRVSSLTLITALDTYLS